ncbi:MAG: glycosyltransferase family 2 protein [Actinomycetota bacterium]
MTAEPPALTQHRIAIPPSSWPLVSVVLPTRGRPELVRESIAGIVNQTYPGDIECFVIHDQEKVDESLATLGRPGRTISVFANDGTAGLAGARNAGLRHVAGVFTASCDDDDVWHPTKIQHQVQRMKDQPDLILVASGVRFLLPEGKTAEWAGRADRVTYRMLLRNRIKELHSSTLLIRTSALAKIGPYDESLPHGYGEDYDYVLRAARTGAIGVVRIPLADIRQNGQSYYQGRAERTAHALETFLTKHPDIAQDRRGHARILGQIAFNRSCMGDRRVAWQLTRQAFTRWPLSPHPYVAFFHLTTRITPARVARLARLMGRGMA